MVADHIEPVTLRIGELLPALLLLSKPCIEVRIDPFRKRNQLIVLMDGEADQRNKISEKAFAACLFYLRFL